MTAFDTISLAGLLVAAVWTDLSHRRIPNRLILVGLGLGWVAAPLVLLASGETWSWDPYTGSLAGLAVLMPLYVVRGCAAGDVKLMALVGAFVGPALVVTATVYAVLAGGVLSLLCMLRPGVAVQTVHNLRFMLTDWLMRLTTRSGLQLTPPATTAARLPYALAIATGTLLTIWQHNLNA